MTWRQNRRIKVDDFTSAFPRPLQAEVTRVALLERVARAGNANLVLLIAPSGYGKTTFLAQLARTESRRSIWLTLTERHTDLGSLCRALLQTAAQAVPELSFAGLRQALAEGAPVKELAFPFARHLDDVDVHLRLLLDQAHLLNEDALGWLESFALALGEGHQLIYCAYDLAAERLARPLASGQALLLTTQDLAFTEEEARVYLEARGSPANHLEVYKQLDGWPAGVGLAAAGVAPVLSQTDLLRSAFDRLPREVRLALPEASVLEVWSEVDAARLGCKLPEGWLTEVRRAGLPLTPLSAQAYRPHTLVVASLDQELREQGGRYRELHARAGREARKGGDLLTALRHLHKAGHVRAALRVAATLVPSFRKEGELLLICELLAPFGEGPLCELAPALASYYGWALLYLGDTERAKGLLEPLHQRQLGNGLVYQALAQIASDQGDKVRSLALLEEGLSTVRDDPDQQFLLQRLKVGYTASLGRFNEAEELALDLKVQAERSGARDKHAAILINLAQVYAMTGNHSARENAIRQALTLLKELQRLETASAFLLYVNLADFYRLQNRLPEALDILERALPIAERKDKVWLSFLLVTYADTHTNQLLFDQAVPLYQKAIRLFDERGATVDAQTTRYKLSDVARLSGDPALALQTLLETRQIHYDEYTLIQGQRDFFEALEDVSRGRLETARGRLSSIRLTTEPDLELRRQAYLLEVGRRLGALNSDQVKAFMGSLDAFGHDLILWIDAEPLKPLYEEMIVRSWYPERFLPFTKPPPAPSQVHSTPAILYVQTLGDTHAHFDGRPVKIPFAKAAELLVWLALHGPATRAKIVDALWDGSRELRHVEYGKLALRRLRSALAAHVAFNPLLYENQLYRLSEKLRVEVDALVTLSTLESGDDLARRDALEIYRGGFLSTIHSEWAEALRTRLHDAALAAAMGLGAAHEHAEPELAAWAYRKAVALEPLHLDGHRALIKLLHGRGDTVGARLAYIAYVRVVENEYGEVPDAALRDLFYPARTKHLN